MANPIVHAEIIGRDPDRLRSFYSVLFGWSATSGAPVAGAVSHPSAYAFNNAPTGASAVPIGIGGGPDFTPRALFYVGVEDVDAALARAVDLGASVVTSAADRPDGELRVALFADPEGNVVGLAGPA